MEEVKNLSKCDEEKKLPYFCQGFFSTKKKSRQKEAETVVYLPFVEFCGVSRGLGSILLPKYCRLIGQGLLVRIDSFMAFYTLANGNLLIVQIIILFELCFLCPG